MTAILRLPARSGRIWFHDVWLSVWGVRPGCNQAAINHAEGVASGVGRASRLSLTFSPCLTKHQKVTVNRHQNLSGKAVPDDIRDRRDACPTAWLRLRQGPANDAPFHRT
jgi:hypothetical protein